MAIAAVNCLKNEPERRLALMENIKFFRGGLEALGFSVGQSRSQILPLIIGETSNCMAFAQRLLEKGVYAQGIRPPTVPSGTSRLRITLMASHTHEQLASALNTFKEIKEEHGLVL